MLFLQTIRFMPDPLGFLQEIRKEAKVIKAAPFSFAVVFVICFLVCWGIFKSDLGLNSETIQAYKERLESINAVLKGSPVESLQVMIYTNNPNEEKVNPSNLNAPALAYSEDSAKPTFTWNVKSHIWQ